MEIETEPYLKCIACCEGNERFEKIIDLNYLNQFKSYEEMEEAAKLELEKTLPEGLRVITPPRVTDRFVFKVWLDGKVMYAANLFSVQEIKDGYANGKYGNKN